MTRTLASILAFLTPCCLFSQIDAYISDEWGMLYEVNMTDCSLNEVGTLTGAVFAADLAYTPDGKLYGINGADIYEINLDNAQGTYVMSVFGSSSWASWTSLVSDEDGWLYITGADGDLVQFHPITGEQNFLGNTGVAAAGDCAFVDGLLYIIGTEIDGGFTTNIFSTSLDDPSNITVIVSGLTAASFGLFTVASSCSDFTVYVSSNSDLLEVDLVAGTVGGGCPNLPMQGNTIYGAATTTEFITSGDCASIDLDEDDSSGLSGNDYLADSLCVTWTFPIGDEDVVIHTENEAMDSLRIYMEWGVQNPGEETLNFPDDGTFTVVGNDTDNIWVYNNGEESLETIAEYLHNTWYTNSNPDPQFGERGVGVVGFSEEFWTDTAYAHINLFPYPEITMTGDQTICEGAAAQFTVTGEAEWYLWNTNQSSTSITASDAGVYEVTAGYGACSVSENSELFVIPELTVDVPDQIIDCEGGPVEINATGSGDYLWSTGVEAPVIFVDQTGWYWCQVQNSCFTEIDSTEVIVIDFPESLLLDQKSLCVGDSAELVPTYLQGSFSWSTGETTPSIWITESGVYDVEIDHYGCTIDDSIIINFAEDLTFEDLLVPNVFSPNHDEKNSWFRPIKIGQPDIFLCTLEGVDLDMLVYDRWGGIMSDFPCKWEGLTPKGREAAEGTYYYILTLHSCKSNAEEKYGYVQLLRD